MNMKNIKYILYTAASVLCLSMTSCSENGYEPGPEPSRDCMEAYFLSSNPSEYILGSESTSVTLEIGRLKADNAASIPVIVEAKDEVFKVPSTVEFQAGEATARLTVSFEGIEIQKEKRFTIRLADEYVNPYTVHDGSDVFSATVLVSSWKKVVNNAQFWFSSILNVSTFSDIYWLEGLNRFRIENFLGTGIDLSYTILNPDFKADDLSTWQGELSPLDHYAEEPSDDGFKYWSLRDADGNWLEWTPAGAACKITGLSVYRTTTYTNIIMGGATEPTGYLTCYINCEDSSYDGWEYINMYLGTADVTAPGK